MNVGDLIQKLQTLDPTLPVYRENVDFEGTHYDDDWVVKGIVVRGVNKLTYPKALVIR